MKTASRVDRIYCSLHTSVLRDFDIRVRTLGSAIKSFGRLSDHVPVAALFRIRQMRPAGFERPIAHWIRKHPAFSAYLDQFCRGNRFPSGIWEAVTFCKVLFRKAAAHVLELSVERGAATVDERIHWSLRALGEIRQGHPGAAAVPFRAFPEISMPPVGHGLSLVLMLFAFGCFFKRLLRFRCRRGLKSSRGHRTSLTMLSGRGRNPWLALLHSGLPRRGELASLVLTCLMAARFMVLLLPANCSVTTGLVSLLRSRLMCRRRAGSWRGMLTLSLRSSGVLTNSSSMSSLIALVTLPVDLMGSLTYSAWRKAPAPCRAALHKA